MSDAMRTHGAFSWSELQTTDVAAAAAFYREVLGWEVQAMDLPNGSYTAIAAGGRPLGGIVPGSGGAARWLAYVTVDDVDARTARAAAAGAVVLKAPFSAPGVGRMATIEDPAGAPICFITYESSGEPALPPE